MAAATPAELTVVDTEMAELTAAGTDTAGVMDMERMESGSGLEWALAIRAITGQPTTIRIITALTDILTPMVTIRLWSAAL